ncbi:MAG: hypothetical protein U0U70_09785 [Chitinophagaceae bacterium]
MLKFFMLDVVDVAPARASGPDTGFYLLLAGTILAEAGIMYLMRYNAFLRALLHSLLANLASLALGFLLIEVMPGFFSRYSFLNLATLMVITILAELPVLYLLNRTKPLKSTALVCVVMNIVSYILFYLYITLFTG